MKNTDTPNALLRLEENIFIKIPLFKAKKTYHVKYVNAELFSKVFNDKNTSFEHMASIIQKKFSTTIDVTKSNGKQIGYAYVDKQADPLNIALSGNLGSGRAYYQEDIYNIKGEKTPLAVSKNSEYSNGVLEFEKAIYETVVSNSIYQENDIKLAPILAILDIQEECRVSWKPGICNRAKIIRLDLEGSLDRISHVFQAKKEMTQNQLEQFAISVGKLEGKKFINRIVHGAWSAGNISKNGHMIDFDTVCSVKYFGPQYSFCPWYIENYFGFEYLGQLKILKSLAPSQYCQLRKILIQTRKNTIFSDFSKLMGLSQIKINSTYKSLVQQFINLSMKVYPVFENLSTKNIHSYTCAPFDFANFFRKYPLLKNRGLFNQFESLHLLMPQIQKFEEFDLSQYDRNSSNSDFFYKHVLKKLDKFLIHNLDELVLTLKECLSFIEKYDRVYETHVTNKFLAEKKAYIFNEDRENMTMIKSIGGPIDDYKKHMSSKEIHKTLETVILSNKRSGNKSNMRVFKNGSFYVKLNNQGKHQLVLNVYDRRELGNYYIVINEIKYKASVIHKNDTLTLKSPFSDNLNLLSYTQISFFCNEHPIKMKPFAFPHTDNSKIQDFSF